MTVVQNYATLSEKRRHGTGSSPKTAGSQSVKRNAVNTGSIILFMTDDDTILLRVLQVDDANYRCRCVFNQYIIIFHSSLFKSLNIYRHVN